MIYRLLLVLMSVSSYGQILHQNNMVEIINSVNAERVKKHREPLEYRAEYQAQCDKWAVFISKSLVHNYSDKRRGEVIGSFITTESIVDLFLQSETHKKILLDKGAKGICFSIYEEPARTIVKKNSVEYIPTLFHTVIRTY